jgi:hypothetical protein
MAASGWRRADVSELMVMSGWRQVWWWVDGSEWMVATGWRRLYGGECMAASGWWRVNGGQWMMMMMIHYSYATLLDHDEIMYIPVLFTVRPDLGQSTGGTQ